MSEIDPLRPIREMQQLLARSLRSLLQLIQHTGPPQLLADQLRRLTRFVAHGDGEAREPAQKVGFPLIEVPAWWRLLEEFEGAYDLWAESLPDNWRNLSMRELEALARTMECTGWVL